MNVGGGVITLEGRDTKKLTIFRKFRDKLQIFRRLSQIIEDAAGNTTNTNTMATALVTASSSTSRRCSCLLSRENFFVSIPACTSRTCSSHLALRCFSLQYSSHYHAYCAVTPSPNYELMLSLEALQSCPTFPPSPALGHKQIFLQQPLGITLPNYYWGGGVKLT